MACFHSKMVSLIKNLLAPCGPTKIPRLIISVVIDPIQSLTLWSRAYGGQDVKSEVLIVVCPSLMHGYSSGTVVLKVFMLRIKATITRLIIGCIEACSGKAMLVFKRTGVLVERALSSAGSYVPRTEVAADYSAIGATITFTKPKGTVSKTGQADYDKMAESLVSKINMRVPHGYLLREITLT